MTQVGDAIATGFTFLVFLLLIIFPMVMAFAQAKSSREAKSTKKSGETSKAASGKKSSRGLFSQLDRLREHDRESEPEVSFSEGRAPAQTKAHKQDRFPEQHTIQQLGEKFNPIEGMKHTAGAALSQRTEIAPTRAARTKRAALPNSPAISRLQELSELQRAIVLSELLGPPKGL